MRVKLQWMSEEAADAHLYAVQWDTDVPQPEVLSATEMVVQCEPEEQAGLQWMVDHSEESGLKAFTIL